MKVISFINYKGGVGKTTTAYHIGCSLALDHGYKVLMVDVDPQTNLTFLCATPERWQNFRDSKGTLGTLYRSYLDGKPSFGIDNIIWKEPIEQAGRKVVPGVDIIPSDVELLTIDLDLQRKTSASYDLSAVAEHHVKQRTILAKALAKVKSEYDYILIDCPPNLYLVTQNALAASDYYVVTALPDHLSTIGLSILEPRVRKMNEELAHASALSGETYSSPELGGIIFVRVRLGGNRITNMHSSKMEQIAREYKGKTFDNYTTEGIGYSEASENALPVFLLSSSNTDRVSEQYRKIAEEFTKRLKV